MVGSGDGIAINASMAMMATTTIISIKVKPVRFLT
jgi:hypothetical protein